MNGHQVSEYAEFSPMIPAVTNISSRNGVV